MSLAGVESTMLLPSKTSHSLLSELDRINQGITDQLIRFSVGIETKKDLIDGWKDWLILLLEPDPIRFFEQESDKTGGFWRFFRRVWIYRAILVQVIPLNLILGLLSLASPFLFLISF